MVSSTICILTGNHLCHNPRVIKEASSLARAGHNVRVLGGWIDPRLKARDIEMLKAEKFHFTPVLDFTESAVHWKDSRFVKRGIHKSARIMGRWIGWENRSQLGVSVGPLLKAAAKIKADLFIAHSEPGLFVARELAKAAWRVGVDMEDWFSEDLLPKARRDRPIALLRNLERQILRGRVHATCPSHAMSHALAGEYETLPPTVIYNAFPWSERESIDGLLKDRKSRLVPSVHWFSQTLGQGRGLEDLVGALPHLRHVVEIHLRGIPATGFEAWLWNKVPENWRDKIFVHDLATNDELLSRIVEHDIGFAGEMNYCRNRDLTITNKILQYLLAGLAVVASDTNGQKEVAKLAPGAVTLYPSGDSIALAARINSLLEAPEQILTAKSAALKAAELTFCWERQEKVILEAVGRAVSLPQDFAV
jgi:glycosyltransferase involved in cell wall biosynthesis